MAEIPRQKKSTDLVAGEMRQMLIVFAVAPATLGRLPPSLSSRTTMMS
jgi:hypothetical protein